MSSYIDTAEVAQTLCRTKMIESFEDACRRAGGGSWDSLKNEPLSQVIRILAVNGVRFYCDDEAKFENVLATLKGVR